MPPLTLMLIVKSFLWTDTDSHSTAAYIAADGQKVPVAAIDGGDKYEALIRDSLDNQGRIV